MRKKEFNLKKKFIFSAFLLLMFWAELKTVEAQESPSVLYVPLIGITSVPTPLALPKGPGDVTYNYAVKNFLLEVPITNVRVLDDNCSPVKFVTGDDNNDSKLDFSETWRYSCTTNIASTTRSTATATGIANNIPAAHKAYTTVVVGSENLPPLISIVNVSQIPYPLSESGQNGQITLTYRVSNPGLVPLSNVYVSDNGCGAISGKLGDTNGNNLLDTNEVWIYSCTAKLSQTTVNTATVSAFANGLKAVDMSSININPNVRPSPNLFDVEISPAPKTSPDLKITIWKILSAVLLGLVIIFVLTRNSRALKK